MQSNRKIKTGFLLFLLLSSILVGLATFTDFGSLLIIPSVYASPAYEDFTTYTEVDPNTLITIGVNTIYADDLSAEEDAYVYKDMGVDYFGDFEHLVDVMVEDQSGTSTAAVWVLSNAIDDYSGLEASTTIAIVIWELNRIEMYEFFSGVQSDLNESLSGNTWYYLTITKVGTALTCKIYTDEARISLFDTLSLTLGADHKFRYIYGLCSRNTTGWSQTMDVHVRNLDFQGLAFSDIIGNTTTPGAICNFTSTISDYNGLSHFIFSYDNGTGTFVNDTAVNITSSGASYYMNLTKKLNVTVGTTIQAQVFGNNTLDKWSNSTIFSFVTVNPVPSITITDPKWGMYNLTSILLNLTASVSEGSIDVIWYNYRNHSSWIYPTNQSYTVPTSMTGFISGNKYTLYVWANSSLGEVGVDIVEFMNDLNAYVAPNGTVFGIQSAIDLAVGAGGGNVTIPAGTWNWTATGWATANITVTGGVIVDIFGAPNRRYTGLDIPYSGMNPNDQVISWNTVLQMNHSVASNSTAWFIYDGQGESFRLSDIKLIGYRSIDNEDPHYHAAVMINCFTDFRIDHSWFEHTSGGIYITTGYEKPQPPITRGVIDHTYLFNEYGIPQPYEELTVGYGVGHQIDDHYYVFEDIDNVLGDYNNYTVVLEDNYFEKWRHFTLNAGGHFIIRHNNFTNDFGYGTLDIHEDFGISSGRANEFYRNNFIDPVSPPVQDDVMWQRGGSVIAYDNYVTGYDDFVMMTYTEQDEAFQPQDTWVWNNTLPGGVSPVDNASGVFTEGVDYFLYEKPGYTEYPYPHPLVVGTNLPPTWSAISTNETEEGKPCLLSSRWEDYDGDISHYKIEHNNTGVFQNVTGSFVNGWANETITLNPNIIVALKVYANDTDGEWSQTSFIFIETTEGGTSGWSKIIMGMINFFKIMGVNKSTIFKINDVE